MADLELNAQPRTIVGRRVKQLRKEGLVPVVLYGEVDNPLNLQVNSKELDGALHHGGMSQLVRLNVGDDVHNVLVRAVQRHPLRRNLMHADFYAINMQDKQIVSVPLVQVGEPEAFVAGDIVLQAMDAIEIEALPAAIPASIEVDITNLTYEHNITVGDIPLSEGIDLLADLGETVFSLVQSAVVEEEEEDELAEELEVDSEPEVIARGKADEDEE